MSAQRSRPRLMRRRFVPGCYGSSGSTPAALLAGVFGGAAFDEVALAPVAAAVDRTGRFARNFADRGVRSGAATMLVFFGDADDRAAEADRLKRLHRDVHGGGQGDFAGVRYSALDPELWKWIGVSGLLVPVHSFTAATGITMTEAECDAAYRMLVDAFRHSSCRVGLRRCGELCRGDGLLRRHGRSRLGSNAFLDQVVTDSNGCRCPRSGCPVRCVLRVTPAWLAARPPSVDSSRCVRSASCIRGVRELTGFRWRAAMTSSSRCTPRRCSWRGACCRPDSAGPVGPQQDPVRKRWWRRTARLASTRSRRTSDGPARDATSHSTASRLSRGRDLKAAVEEIELVGVARASLDVVARQAGVSRSTLYRRFPTRDALSPRSVAGHSRPR